MRHSKIWEMENSTDIDKDLINAYTPEEQVKIPAYKRPERSRASFLQE
jgi:hypothetical protein